MPRILTSLIVLAVLSASTGCALFDREDRAVDPASNARQLYEKAQRALETGNFRTAISNYETLTAVYPFSEYSKQAQLDLMYAYWQNNEPESAESIADQFMLENPTHPRVDYAMYIKGLAWFPEKRNPVDSLFRVDLTKRPPGELTRSFNAFSQMLQRYPDSPYAEDARQRMVYLRNRLAAYEIHVADYYVRRSAYVAAANRARYVVQNYQETPSVVDALQIMLRAYRELGLSELAEDTLRVLAENYPDQAFAWGGRRASLVSRKPGPVSEPESPK